jgi:hypothetical protein
MHRFLAATALLTIFDASWAILPPGYEDKLYCAAGFCMRDKIVPLGFTGPAHAFHECFNSGTGSVQDVQTWGSFDGEDARQLLLSQGFHENSCPLPVDHTDDGGVGGRERVRRLGGGHRGLLMSGNLRREVPNGNINQPEKKQIVDTKHCCKLMFKMECAACHLGFTVEQYCDDHCHHQKVARLKSAFTSEQTILDDMACAECITPELKPLKGGDVCQKTEDRTKPTLDFDRGEDCPEGWSCKTTRSRFSFVVGGPEVFTCQQNGWTR